MRNLSEFKDIHKGNDIYIIGSGYSCEFIDSDFFSDKITIGINQVYKKFPVKYLIRKEHNNLKGLFKEYESAIWFVSEFKFGAHNQGKLNMNDIKDNNHFCVYPHTHNTLKFEYTTLPDDKLITSYSTITTGIHLAAYMGAKTIILVGHDCGTLDDQCNFIGYHTAGSMGWKNGVQDYIKWLPGIEDHTIKLKKLIKDKYNCNLYSLNPFVNFGLEGHIYKKSSAV